jgi:hypothetical protein
MIRRKIQFSLSSMLLFLTATALILALSFHLPGGHFALDSSRWTLGTRDIAVRIAVLTPLALLELAGVVLMLRFYRRRRYRR